METAATTLTDFLLARIAEDEESACLARGAARDSSGRWASWNRSWDNRPYRDLAADGVRITKVPVPLDEHIARHDPARVLAECEAKRKIVERCIDLDPGSIGFGGIVPQVHAQGLEEAIAWLALPYADHPDYREEWRP